MSPILKTSQEKEENCVNKKNLVVENGAETANNNQQKIDTENTEVTGPISFHENSEILNADKVT